jgi:DNA polymerase-3 subunit gamma/tau
MPLNVLYRPQSIEEIVGNDSGIKSLSSKLTSDDVPKSYFFTGPPGCGKTTLAYVIKEELKIHNFDFYEYDTANTRGIDTIREIRRNIDKAPMAGVRKLYLLDECHQITGAAMEALLKTLESPPAHVIICLCTSEPEKIKPNTLKAVRRRCFELEVKSLTRGQILKLLNEILEAEEVAEFPTSITRKIATSCWGSPGQALSLLDSVIDMESEEEALEAIENLVVSEKSVKNLIDVLVDNRISSTGKWTRVRDLIPDIKGDPESIRYAVCGYLDKVLLGRDRVDPRLLSVASCFTESFMYTGRVGLTIACALACNSGKTNEDDIPF